MDATDNLSRECPRPELVGLTHDSAAEDPRATGKIVRDTRWKKPRHELQWRGNVLP